MAGSSSRQTDNATGSLSPTDNPSTTESEDMDFEPTTEEDTESLDEEEFLERLLARRGDGEEGERCHVGSEI